MKIAIIGTRGIPNHYGGFEQFAEYLSKGLLQKGHEVFVYNSHNHPYKESTWQGVNIIHAYDPEEKIGTAGQFIYDLNCILDSRKRTFDIILQLGYTSSSIWYKLMPKRALVFTNMDGLEWKRTKYSKKVQQFLKWAEKLAALNSDYLIADSLGIQKYLKEKYDKDSSYIPYGAEIFKNPDVAVIKPYDLTLYDYDLLIARLEPENSIEVILNGVIASNAQRSFLVIGNFKTQYGNYLREKFKDSRIKFLGSIYDINILNNLRYYSNIYFHGHTVGGTNPSLLEAMASEALICANKNEFNHSILGSDAYYFNSEAEVKEVLEKVNKGAEESKMVASNIEKIQKLYSWPKIVNDYNEVFIKGIKK